MNSRFFFYLLIITSAFIAYGSLYPFHFTLHQATHNLIHIMQNPFDAGRSDAISNVILFIPFGLFAFYTNLPTSSNSKKAIMVMLLAIGFSTILQLMQIFIPSRVPSTDDIFWNTVGTFFGFLAALIIKPWLQQQSIEAKPQQILTIVVIASWLAYQLIPFVPALDWQAIKDSVKPLYISPDLSLFNIIQQGTAWTLVIYFWQRCNDKTITPLFILVAALAIIISKVFIIDNYLSWNTLIAMAGGSLIYLFVLRFSGYSTVILLFATVVVLCLNSLYPFIRSFHPNHFSWIPFAAALKGNIVINVTQLLFKLFFYSSFILLLRHSGLRWLWCGIISGLLLLFLEGMQIFFYWP